MCLKNRYFEEQIHWVPLYVGIFENSCLENLASFCTFLNELSPSLDYDPFDQHQGSLTMRLGKKLEKNHL